MSIEPFEKMGLAGKAALLFVSLMVAVGITLDLKPSEVSGFLNGVFASLPQRDQSVVMLLILFGVYALIASCVSRRTRVSRGIVLPLVLAGLFSVCMLLGWGFDNMGGVAPLFESASQVVKSIWRTCSYWLIAFCLIDAVFCWLDRRLTRGIGDSIPKGAAGAKLNQLASCPKKAFLASFFAFLVVWSPWFIGSAPGLFVPGDIGNEILAFFGYPDVLALRVNLIDETVPWTTHHPAFHVMLVGGCVKAGLVVFGSENVGILLFAVLQYVSYCAAFAFSVYALSRLSVNFRVMAAYIAFVALMPLYANYSVTLTKDTLFCAVLVAFLSVLALLCFSRDALGKKIYLLFFALAALLALLRSGAVLFAFAGIVIALLSSEQSRRWLVLSGMGAMVVYVAFSSVLVPAMHISPASSGEMLSIPFQQTARYVKEHPDEVTEEQRRAIDVVLDYDTLAERYVPGLSDKVKNEFSKDATEDDVKAYFKAWAEMGAKHPETYLAATAANYYAYFYPSKHDANGYYDKATSAHSMDVPRIAKYFDFHHWDNVVSDGLAYTDKGYFSVWKEMPILSLCMTSAFWMWTFICLIAYCLSRRMGRVVAISLPVILTVLVFLVGPCNGWVMYRYIFSVIATAPFLIALLWSRNVRLGGCYLSEG